MKMTSPLSRSKYISWWIVLLTLPNNFEIGKAGTKSLQNEDVVISAVHRLCSDDRQERRTAMREIDRIGARAIPSLVSFLDELTEYSRNIPQGARAKENDSVPSSTVEGKRCLVDAKGNWEVSADVCDLLGRLHAIEAIPILLNIVENREVITRVTTMTPEMQALVNIGYPAVPSVIEFFNSAESRAESIRFGEPLPSSQVQTRYKQGQAAIMRARAATILSQIGDLRGLGALKAFLRLAPRADWQPDLPYIEDAITKLRMKNGIQ